MTSVIIEIGIIFLLLLANGVFAMTEIAVVSANKGRLRRKANEGSKRARAALELAESPNRFLATVQIGITLVGILAGAFGGATIAGELQRVFESVPLLAGHARAIAMTFVVVLITFFSLVIGELAPKRFGLANPEGIAMALARPMEWLSRITGPIVKLLGSSTDVLLRVVGFRPQKEQIVPEEEVKVLMQEGLRAGAFNQVESRIVHSALELDEVAVREIMTPRPKIIWLKIDDSHETVWHKIVVSRHSYFPVYEVNRDHVVGIVGLKAIYANVAAGTQAKIRDLMTQPMVVPATQTVLQLLEMFKQSGRHLTLVADEFGSIAGLVTLHDVMEAVVGELPSAEERAKPSAIRREDGSWLIDGLMDIDRLQTILADFKLSTDESKDYQTLAGFLMKELGHLPHEGETVESQGYLFEVLDMDRHRIDKVLVIPKGSVPQAPSQLSHPMKR
jgi:putative hemolysin